MSRKMIPFISSWSMGFMGNYWYFSAREWEILLFSFIFCYFWSFFTEKIKITGKQARKIVGVANGWPMKQVEQTRRTLGHFGNVEKFTYEPRAQNCKIWAAGAPGLQTTNGKSHDASNCHFRTNGVEKNTRKDGRAGAYRHIGHLGCSFVVYALWEREKSFFDLERAVLASSPTCHTHIRLWRHLPGII